MGLALELQARRSVRVSAETIRRWLHELGWVWKRAKLAAKDDDPQRVEKLARSRYTVEHLPTWAALFFADELDLSLLPKVGSQWMPQGEQLEVPTPGTNEKRYLAGAWDLRRGTVVHRVWWRKTHGLFLDLLATLDRTYPPLQFTRLYVVVDNYKIHKAQAVAQWLAAHPRFELLFLPTYCPQASPIEERPTDYTWSAPQAQQRTHHLSLSPSDRPDGRGGSSLSSQGGPSVLGHCAP